MESSKSSESQDRLSELPDALLVLILSLLKAKDVIRTSVLSKRWKYLWMIVPCLKFEDYSDDCVRFQNIVNRTLLLREGAKLLKFGVDFWYKPSAAGDVDLWLNIAMENGIEELCVNLVNELEAAEYMDTEYWAPERLYLCSSVRKLSLTGCNLKIHGRVQWNKLRCLIIGEVVLREHVMDQILSGSPQLEVLDLRLAESYENLNIRSSSLKKLFIDKYFRGYEVGHTVLTIWAPNVETLEITGFPFDEYVVMNVSSLTDATVYFQDPPLSNAARYSRYKLYGDILAQIDYSVRRIAKLQLPYWDQVTRELRKKDIVAPLSDAKYLKVFLYNADILTMASVLAICPKLSTLVLERDYEFLEDCADTFEIHCDIREAFATENSFESIIDFPKSHLLHLKKFEMITDLPEHCVLHPGHNPIHLTGETVCFGQTSIFSTIVFLLNYSSKLETLVLHVTGRIASESKFLIESFVQALPKFFENVEVILR